MINKQSINREQETKIWANRAQYKQRQEYRWKEIENEACVDWKTEGEIEKDEQIEHKNRNGFVKPRIDWKTEGGIEKYKQIHFKDRKRDEQMGKQSIRPRNKERKKWTHEACIDWKTYGKTQRV